MKTLSEKQAGACENAKHPRCACRCGGVLHGAARTTEMWTLPADDPHQPDPQSDLFAGAEVGATA